MKLKLLITILVLATLFSGVVLWRVDRFVYGDRMAWAEAQARTQLSSLSQAISTEIQSSRRMLSSVNNETFKREHTNWKAFQPYYAVALMTSQDGVLGLSRLVTKADSPAAHWTLNDLTQYIGFMGKGLENRGSILLRSFKDPQKNRHVAVIFSGGGSAYILIGSGENFQSLIESQKGSLSAISIIANDGLTISHAIPEYIGNVMSDSSLLKEIRTTGAVQGLGAYQQGRRQVFGMYSQIPGTNSYVVSSVPIEDLLKGRLSLAWQFVFMAVGILLLGSALYFWLEKQQPSTVTAAPLPPLMPEPQPYEAPSAKALLKEAAPLNLPVTTPQNMQQEKTDAYRQIATALGQEMRSPLASILGFSQMVLAKTQDPEVVQAVESILREARNSRDVLEKLVTFTGERSSDKKDSKIEGPLMQALKNLDLKLTQKGIRVEKDFKETSPWPLAATDLTKAFENLFTNAIEAMERMQEKVLKIFTWESAEGLHVRITDSGEGIEMENLAKVFDPFFTTRSFAHHVGLGLPVVVGILKEHNGKIQIQSQPGKGTQIEIIFKVSAGAVARPMAPTVPPPMSKLELPEDLPKAPLMAKKVLAMEKEPETLKEPLPKEKLTEVNVDTLLELPAEDEPLRFLEGEGFENSLSSAKPPVLSAPVAPPVAPPEVAPPAVSSLEPSAEFLSAIPAKKSVLDSYKVEIRRPGKRI
ncbi:MAG: ATP-binding protein [Pseudobdellovibrionaceae bacterium]